MNTQTKMAKSKEQQQQQFVKFHFFFDEKKLFCKKTETKQSCSL
jgi:hypothetical protein